MTTEIAALLAVLAAPTAVLAIVVAVVVARIARRGRDGLVRSAPGLERQEAAIQEELVSARATMARVTTSLTAVRAQGRSLDPDLVGWTAELSAQRQTIERLNRGRLGPAVRAMQLAGALARVALLWRTPAR